jgi:hypothetical protein
MRQASHVSHVPFRSVGALAILSESLIPIGSRIQCSKQNADSLHVHANVNLHVQQIAHPLTFDPIGIQNDRIHPKKVACPVHNEKRATGYSGLCRVLQSRLCLWAGGTKVEPARCRVGYSWRLRAVHTEYMYYCETEYRIRLIR